MLIYSIFLIVEIGLYGLILIILNFFVILVQKLISNKIRELSVEIAKVADQRGKLISDAVNGMKMIKFNAWENIIEKKINEYRKTEYKLLLKTSMLNSINRSFQFIGPKSIILIVFYVLWLSGTEISVASMFLIVSIANGTIAPLASISAYLGAEARSQVSVKRIADILKIKEKDMLLNDNTTKIGEIQVIDASFSWEDPINEAIFATPSLQPAKDIISDISFKISPGQFIGVVGEVGSGKTSLLLSMIGELNMTRGSIRKNGRIAYVPQEAVLINETLQNNITFGTDLLESRYKETLSLCELETDLLLLPARDQTEIGERGINLSGGQKQRISIARATYSYSDIFIIDDALSALDGDVGGRIMDNLFIKKLKGKTRVMVTHKLSILDAFDRIIFMKHGRIVKIGNLNELKEDKEFQEFISHSKLDEARTSLKQTKNNSELNPIQEIGVSTSRGDLTKLEKSQDGIVGTRSFLYYFSQGGIFMFIITVVLFLMTNASRMWIDWWLGKNLESTFGKSSQMEGKMFFVAINIGFLIIIILRTVFFSFSVAGSSFGIYKNMMQNLFRRSMSYFDTTPVGIIMNRCNNDALAVDSRLSLAFLVLFNALSLYVVTLGVISYYTIVILFFCIALGWYLWNRLIEFLKISIPIARMQRIASSPVLSKFNEMIVASVLIRQYQKQDFFRELFISISNMDSIVYLHNIIIDAWLFIRIEAALFLVTSTFMIIITTAKILNLLDSESVLMIGLIIMYILMLGDMSGMLLFSVSAVMKEASSVERIQDFTEIKELEDVLYKDNVPVNWPNKSSIEFRDLDIRYRDGLPLVLKALNLTVKGGEKLGIIGRTGSGKSTLFLALYRIMEVSSNTSKILIDGIDIRTLGIHDLRRRITIIPQDPFIMEGTLRFNIDPFEMYEDTEILECLDKVGILRSIVQPSIEDTTFNQEESLLLESDKLREDNSMTILNFKIDSRGSNLSSGQRQLISIARALICKPKILLMDEATANIDERSDSLLQKMFKEDFASSTIITIAHRLETLAHYDRIAIMDAGKVSKIAPPSEIFNNIKSDLTEYL